MKKRVHVKIILIFLCAIFSLLIVSAQGDVEKINKAFNCLDSRVNETSELSLEEAIFSALAEVPSSKVNNTINANKAGENCWPKSGCSTKITAQAILAKNRLGQNTTASEKWLLSQSGLSTGLSWFLQITIENNLPASCEIRYNNAEPGYTIEIDNEMKIKQDKAGACLTRTASGYWLQVENNCLDKEFDISCQGESVTQFKTNLLYQKSSGGTIYVSANTHGASAKGWTTEKINALCFKQGNSCNYEGSLWAAIALYKTKTDFDNDKVYDYEKFAPYLKALASDNEQLFPSAFLMHILGKGKNGEHYSSIIEKWNPDPDGGFWQIGSQGRYYDSALGLLALGGADAREKEVQDTLKYLFKKQTSKGCWNNDNIRDTAFIIYSAGWQRGGGVQQAVCGNEIVEPENNEQCEPSVKITETCEGLKLGKGNLSCYAQGHKYECRFNTTGCENGTEVPPPGPIETKLCLNVSGTCKTNCNANETESKAKCETGICCIEKKPGGGPYNPFAPSDCKASNYFCVSDDYACSDAGGTPLYDLNCESWKTCCTKNVQELPNCASQGGKVCVPNEEECSAPVVQSSDGACCLTGCKPISKIMCNSDSDCSSDEECKDGECMTKETSECTTDEDCGSNEVCINKECVAKKSNLWIWIVGLLVLIGLVVLGIIYKDKLRLWLAKRKTQKGKPAGGWPPPPGGVAPGARRMPPRFGPPTARPSFVPAQRMPARALARATPVSRPVSEKDKEMEETLKKLKEMSK